MKRYTLKLTAQDAPNPEQSIRDQIIALNDFVCSCGITAINGLREDFAAKIELRYNTLLSALEEIYKNFSAKSMDSHLIQVQLNALNLAFKQLENDHICKVYTGKITCSEIGAKISSLEENIFSSLLAPAPTI